MPRYRKKPVEIDAFQFDGDFTALDRWLDLLGYDEADGPAMHRGDDGTLRITTLEGEMTASIGDFIIRGVQGEFYPCKPDIFAATYDAA